MPNSIGSHHSAHSSTSSLLSNASTAATEVEHQGQFPADAWHPPMVLPLNYQPPAGQSYVPLVNTFQSAAPQAALPSAADNLSPSTSAEYNSGSPSASPDDTAASAGLTHVTTPSRWGTPDPIMLLPGQQQDLENSLRNLGGLLSPHNPSVNNGSLNHPPTRASENPSPANGETLPSRPSTPSLASSNRA
jgi:hypothetical protein